MPCRTQVTFGHPNLPGQGFSLSSVKSVLRAASDLFQTEGKLSPKAVAHLALVVEWALADGLKLAIQDVWAVVAGNASLISWEADHGVAVEDIACDAGWLRDNFLIAWLPNGHGHSAPNVVKTLVEHPRAKDFVGSISALAPAAAAALAACDLGAMRDALAGYVSLLQEWTEGGYVSSPVSAAVKALHKQLPGEFCWKPPGAGGASSLLVGTPEKAAATSLLRNLGWEVENVELSPGLTMENPSPGVVRISAPLRLDLVGAGDLAAAVGAPRGMCCALGIAPRSDVTLEVCGGAPPRSAVPSPHVLKGIWI